MALRSHRADSMLFLFFFAVCGMRSKSDYDRDVMFHERISRARGEGSQLRAW